MYPTGIDKDNFLFIRHDSEPWTLINPIHQGVHWTKDMLWYRSRVQADNGDIVSMGFPKFRNLGENEDDRQVVEAVVKTGSPVEYSEKLDGSLLIRSVYNGKIILRSRGSFGLGFVQEARDEITRIIAEQMPELNDPMFGAGMSFLFEYVSPLNQIVLKNTAARIVCIGAVQHDLLHVWSPIEVQSKFPELNWDFNLVQYGYFANIPDLIDWVEKNTLGQEGIVVRVGTTLVKVKNSDYLRKHRLKFYITDVDLAYTCLRHNLLKHEDFDHLAAVFDVDFETLEVLREKFSAFVEKFAAVLTEFQGWKDFVASRIHLDKKAFAQNVIPSVPKHRQSLCFALFDSKTTHVHRLILPEFGIGIGGHYPLDEIMSIALERAGFDGNHN